MASSENGNSDNGKGKEFTMKRSDSIQGSIINADVIGEQSGNNFLGGMFNVSNAALGAGLLTFPRSFATTGLVGGVILQFVVTFLIFVSLTVIGYATHITASHTYPMVLRRLLGTKVEIFAVCLLVFFTWSVCISYLQVIAEQFDDFGRLIADPEGTELSADCPNVWYLSGRFLMVVISTLVVFPAAMLRSMTLVSRVSVVAIAACWYIVIFIIYSAITTDNGCPNPDDARKKLDETPFFWRLLATFPAMCFGYQCHLSSVNNFASLGKKAKASYTYVVLGGSMVCLVTYTAVGVAGNLLFGPCAGNHSLVLGNFGRKDVGANIGRGFVSLAVAFSYPLFSFAGRQELLRLFDTCCAARSWEISESNIFIGTLDRRRIWLTIIWYISSVGIACIPGDGLSQIINCIGTFSGFWMFLFPGLFALRLANLAHEETIDAALAKLSDAHEEVCDSWTNGIRSRITWWLTARERKMVQVVGWVLLVVAVALSIVGFSYFFYSLVQFFMKDAVDKCTEAVILRQ